MGSLRGPNPHSASETELSSSPKVTSTVPIGFCPKSHTSEGGWDFVAFGPFHEVFHVHVRQPQVVHQVGRLGGVPGGRRPHFTLPTIFHQPRGLPRRNMPQSVDRMCAPRGAAGRHVHPRAHQHRGTHGMADPHSPVATLKQRTQPQQGGAPHKGGKPCARHPTQSPSQPLQPVAPPTPLIHSRHSVGQARCPCQLRWTMNTQLAGRQWILEPFQVATWPNEQSPQCRRPTHSPNATTRQAPTVHVRQTHGPSLTQVRLTVGRAWQDGRKNQRCQIVGPFDQRRQPLQGRYDRGNIKSRAR